MFLLLTCNFLSDFFFQAEDKLNTTKVLYEDLHEELIQDMRNLVHDKEKFFDPIVANVCPLTCDDILMILFLSSILTSFMNTIKMHLT
jgi:hypothetical protein